MGSSAGRGEGSEGRQGKRVCGHQQPRREPGRGKRRETGSGGAGEGQTAPSMRGAGERARQPRARGAGLGRGGVRDRQPRACAGRGRGRGTDSPEHAGPGWAGAGLGTDSSERARGGPVCGAGVGLGTDSSERAGVRGRGGANPEGPSVRGGRAGAGRGPGEKGRRSSLVRRPGRGVRQGGPGTGGVADLGRPRPRALRQSRRERPRPPLTDPHSPQRRRGTAARPGPAYPISPANGNPAGSDVKPRALGGGALGPLWETNSTSRWPASSRTIKCNAVNPGHCHQVAGHNHDLEASARISDANRLQ